MSKLADKHMNEPPHRSNTILCASSAFSEIKLLSNTLFLPENDKGILPWAGILVWPLMISLPLILTSSLSPINYEELFESSWYEYDYLSGDRPKVLGLCLGIGCVFIGQVFVIIYFYLHKYCFYSNMKLQQSSPPSVQVKGAPIYDFFEGLRTHLSSPGGIVLLALYLGGTWMCRLMPPAYYSFEGSIDYKKVLMCLITQDGIQYMMHRLEHSVSPTFYQFSHKPHHKFHNPRIFDAFNGSVPDTAFMILLPLYVTALIHNTCNVWTYMAFGSFYANWLTLIHSEYPLPWDKFFRLVGFGTPGDHHVHHKIFKYNYGHLFMWYDRAFGTYMHPMELVPKMFSPYA